ncbi:MAG: DUF697 domain-containing protein [Kiritimatiellae bacterium]|nr:DUF697 domain-containing protein [Kiritimatiellia bacterium]
MIHDSQNDKTSAQSVPKRTRSRLYEGVAVKIDSPEEPDQAGEYESFAFKPGMEDVYSKKVNSKEPLANLILDRYIFWSMSWSLVPVPLLNKVAVPLVQLKMLSKLSQLYGVPFSENRGKSILAAFVGGFGSIAASEALVKPLLSSVPVLGVPLYMLSSSTFSVAATYAVGKVFIQHYERGGTLLDLRPEETKTYYARQFKEGTRV